jgi:alpha-mannosidase
VRRAFDLISCGVIRHAPIDSWVVNGLGIKLPILLESTPDQLIILETSISVPSPTSSSSEWFLKLVLSGNALVEISGHDRWGYDEAHTYFPITPGEHRVTVRATPRSLFGYHAWEFRFERALLIEASWSIIRTGLWLLQLVDFTSILPKNSELNTELTKLLLDVTSGLRLAPSPRQIALATILLYEGPTGLYTTRRDLYRPYSDYMFLTGVYGIGILKGALSDPPGNYTSLEEALRVAKALESKLVNELSKLREKYNKRGVLHIVGHSHIDAAWLWPRSETIEKVLRTFSTIVSLMRQYDFTYIQSSALYYKWVEEKNPSLLEEIKRLVESGKWIIAGGMWVECDTNLITGESLARQLLYGQRFFKEKFSRQARIGFLPDSFGFSANMPQLLRKSGLHVFITQKIMWNDTTEFPYHTFNWRGLDGTEIPVQVIVSSYSEPLTPTSVYKHWDRYKDKEKAPDVIYTYGYSNGGGGPTREMLSYIDLLEYTPATPKIRHFKEEEYIETLEKAVRNAPVHYGELYLEFHRGTYTTNIQIKDLVAKSERLLVVAEEALSLIEHYEDREEDWELLKELWERVLFAEFHDVLPGSSIREVYLNTERDLLEVIKSSSQLIYRALEAVGGGTGDYILVFNPLPWRRRALIKIPADLGTLENYECQELDDYNLVLIPETTPSGIKTYKYTSTCRSGVGVEATTRDDGIILKNNYVYVTVNSKGAISSLKLGQVEFLREPSQLVVHSDMPGFFDAWEVTTEFLEQGDVIEASEKPQLVVSGPLLSCVEVTREYGASRIRQLVCVEKDSPVIRVTNHVMWREKSTLVKHWFKTKLKPMRAYYEVPFGVVERPTRMENPWEKARFEVPAVSWADFTDMKYGLAIIAPSRHGYSARGADFSISLLRSPTFPNPWSDLGNFEFTYHLYPHRGDYDAGEVPRIALESTIDTYTSQANREVEYSILTIQPPRVLLSAFKKSEDSDGYTVRLYNPYSKNISVNITLGFKAKQVYETDIPELEILSLLASNTSTLRLSFRPFEVKTLKLIPTVQSH